MTILWWAIGARSLSSANPKNKRQLNFRFFAQNELCGGADGWSDAGTETVTHETNMERIPVSRAPEQFGRGQARNL